MSHYIDMKTWEIKNRILKLDCEKWCMGMRLGVWVYAKIVCLSWHMTWLLPSDYFIFIINYIYYYFS